MPIGPRSFTRAVPLLALAIAGCGRTEIDRLNPEGGGGGGAFGATSGVGGVGGATGGVGGVGGATGGVGGSSGGCPAGSFAPNPSIPLCVSWSDCGPGSRVLAPGTSTHDRVCMLCPDGQSTTSVNAPACEPIHVTQLALGDYHTCALLSDGTVRCWGKNDRGQLGYGNTNTIGDDELPSSVPPVSVSITPGLRVTQLVADIDRTCALLSDGSVKCWGDNRFGLLGTGNRDTIGDDELPAQVVPVSITTIPGVKATALAAGGSHTCALLSDGSVSCWGSNGNGALGYGKTDTIGDDELPSSVGPVDIIRTPGVRVARLAAGRFHTCVVLSDSTLKCWGLNEFGELGYGNTDKIGDDETPSSVGPISVTTTPGVAPIAVVAGDWHTCALLSDGSVRCWGSTLDGELGYGNKTKIGDDELPSSVGPVSIVSANLGLTVTALVAGFDHNCALLSDGSLKCWGANVMAELGTGSRDSIGDDELPSSIGPVSVTTTPGVTVTAVAAGYGHTCALLSDGSVKCWGDNRFGQLGYGHTQTIGDDELPSSVGPVAIF